MNIHSTTAETLGVDPSLHLATRYRRDIHASVERIWENVFDWEHLPVLHEMLFNRAELLAGHDAGWTVKLTRQPGDASRMQVLELRADRSHRRYRVKTLEGSGTGTEIHTQMEPLAANLTAIEVRYYLPEHRPEKLDVLAAKYRSSCQQLWDEDETMMVHRERMAALPAAVALQVPGATVVLGTIEALRARLPLTGELGGHPFRLVDLGGGELAAHATVCPHWLGPLDAALVEDGCVRCPWHGYRFDVRTGASADGRGLQLPPAPAVFVDPATRVVTLVAPT
ncbi:MAG: Rieske (2Fe-2S) protein [Pseudomonadota bacterium]|nr:Rieske (2Fe-2S) protein [Pseudomonadota bacterium]